MCHSGRPALQGGENVCGGKGYFSPRDFVSCWMKSPQHRTWLLDPRVKAAAVGIFRSRYGTYAAWTWYLMTSRLTYPKLEGGKMKKRSDGFGEVTLNVTGVNVAYNYQIVGDRMYLSLDKRGPFILGDAMVSELGELVKETKRREGLRVILAGRLPAVWQLRPDLEEFYVGLPDDYRVEGAYGISARKKPVRIKLGKVDFDMVSLAETGARKMASILGWRKDESGSITCAPAEGRETDVSDYYLITLTLLGAEEADKGAAPWNSYLKTKLPDLHARMRAAGLLVGVE